MHVNPAHSAGLYRFLMLRWLASHLCLAGIHSALWSVSSHWEITIKRLIWVIEEESSLGTTEQIFPIILCRKRRIGDVKIIIQSIVRTQMNPKMQ